MKLVGPKQISYVSYSALYLVLRGDHQVHPHHKQTATWLSHLFTSSFIGTLPCAGEHREEEASKLALLSVFNFGEGYPGPETLWADPSSANMSQIMKAPIQSLSSCIQLQRQTTTPRPCSLRTAIWVSLLHCYSVKYKLRFPRTNNRSEFGIEMLYLGIPQL